MDLLGEEFAALVDDLHKRVLALQAGVSTERLMLLEAESGSGKSRVIRELYARMRLTQTVNVNGQGYWPPLEAGATRGEQGREALRTRKVIGPQTEGFVRPPGTLPDFIWLQVQCAQAPSEALIPAIELLWPSLRAHTKYIAEAWRQKAGLGERSKRAAKDQLSEHVEDLSTEASVEALSRLLGVFDIAVPGLGWIATKTAQAGTAVYKRQKFRREVEAGGELDSGLQPASELARQLLRMAHRELPLIVVVEDAHLMDDGLAEALGLLAEPDPKAPPALVIATAWPEGRTREAYQRWRRAMLTPDDGRTRAVLVADGSAHPFPSLTLNDRVRMVRDYAAATDQATAELIATKWGNPYALRMALSGGRMQRRIRDEAFFVTREDLDTMPRNIEDLYRDRWAELPEPVRQALMLAAGALPNPEDDGSIWPYLIDVVTQATAHTGLLDDPGVVSTALDEAVDPFEWARLADRDLDLAIFREWVLQRIALDEYQAEYDKHETRDFAMAVADEIAQRIDHARGDGYLILGSDPSGLPLSRWLLALQPDRNDASAATAALTVSHALQDTRPNEVVRLLTQPDRIAALPDDDPWTLWGRTVVARALAASGKVQEAIERYLVLLEDRKRLLGPGHPDTLDVRGGLAAALADAGRVQEAIEAYEALLEDQIRLLGVDHPDTLNTRGNLVWTLGITGRVQEAIDQNQALLADKLRVLGPDHPDTLATRNNLAVALAEAGMVQEAIDQIQTLLEVRVRVLGPDNPETLATRQNFAEALHRAGRTKESIRQNSALLEDRMRVLGPDHPDTLAARGNLAVALTAAGLLVEAIEQYEGLLEDRMRVLGSDHPDTLATRGYHTSALAQVGDVQEAIDQFGTLLEDQVRILGPDHPDTLETRGDLAVALAEAGMVEEAIDQVEVLLGDRMRVLGPVHPDTLDTRHNYAAALADAGRFQEAIDQNEALLEDRMRVLGPDHPRTLLTRQNLAAALSGAGRPAEAIEAYQRLLADQVRILGPDHPDTLETRSGLASTLADAGRVQDAISEYQALLADQVRVLGPEHADTVKLRQVLADLRGSGHTGEEV